MEKFKTKKVSPPELVSEAEAIPLQPLLPLSAAERARVMTQARTLLHGIDQNADGVISEADLQNTLHEPMAAILLGIRQQLSTHNEQTFPWLAKQSQMIENITLFSRDQLIDALQNNEELSGLSRQDIDTVITDALPGGVHTITLAQECQTHRELPCLPVGDRVMVHLHGPAI